MFAYIKGSLEMKLKNYIVIDVGGLGYKIFMSETAINEIGEIGENIKVFTYYRVREDDISIFGFRTQEELRMFELLLSALIGLIPNCASSVVITEFYLDGVINAGSMMAGLLVNAGVGMLVLFRLNRHVKQNLSIVLTVYLLGVFWGFVIQIAGIIF